MDNIFTAVWPLYLVSKVFGLFPVTFTAPPKKGNFVQKQRDYIVPVLNVLLAITLIPLIILYPMSVDSYSPLMSTILHLIGIFGTAFNFIPFFYQLYKRNSIKKFILDLHNFDKLVS